MLITRNTIQKIRSNKRKPALIPDGFHFSLFNVNDVVSIFSANRFGMRQSLFNESFQIRFVASKFASSVLVSSMPFGSSHNLPAQPSVSVGPYSVIFGLSSGAEMAQAGINRYDKFLRQPALWRPPSAWARQVTHPHSQSLRPVV